MRGTCHLKTTKFNNDISKMVQVLTVIFKTGAYHSAETTVHVKSQQLAHSQSLLVILAVTNAYAVGRELHLTGYL